MGVGYETTTIELRNIANIEMHYLSTIVLCQCTHIV